MAPDPEADVPSPIDLRTMADARQWAEAVSAKRPWREDFFRIFIDQMRPHVGQGASVLELGSGPGFLAQRVMEQLSFGRYTALDFSEAMHTLARERLGMNAKRVEFVTRDFLSTQWNEGLPRYDVVVTLQAVHELRHKRRAPILYAEVNRLLAKEGVFLVCDHYTEAGDMKNTSLFMTLDEHENALRISGFQDVTCLLNKGGMVLYRARLNNN